MSATAVTQPEEGGFRPRALLALILIGVTALAGFGVLAAYAPELRGARNGGAHALSSSAVGYRGALLMLRSLGTLATVSRARPSPRLMSAAGLVITPEPRFGRVDLSRFPKPLRILIVLPKWATLPDPLHPGFVRKAGPWPPDYTARLLPAQLKGEVALESGLRRRTLTAAGGPFAPGARLPLGPLDGLQTIGGPGWRPVLTDERGRAVLAQSTVMAGVYVLADPDLLNNQGLSDRDTARAGMAILAMISGEQGVVFDVTTNGIERARSIARLMLEPPWLAATLCAAAAAALMGWRATVRFGAPALEGRAIALGAAALVDNAAGLIRAARKEAALAPDYAQTTFRLVAAAGGAHDGRDPEAWVADAAARRGLDDPQSLADQAARARNSDELLAQARRLYQWRLEMTRERS